MGKHVTRIGGVDRIDTSIKISDHIEMRTGYRDVVYSDGWNHQTSALAGNLATRLNGAQVLVNRKVVDPRIIEHMSKSRAKNRSYVGRESEAKEYLHLGLATYLFDDIGELSVRMNAATGCAGEAAGIATGVNFPDALTGGTHIGFRHGCLYLVDPTPSGELSLRHVGQFIRANVFPSRRSIYIYGGESAIPNSVVDKMY